MGDLVVVAAFWTIVGLIVFIGARRRTSSFRRLASRLGLEHRHGSFDLGSYPIPLFDRGTDRGVRDAMLGTWKGEEVVVLDFWYARPTCPARTDRTTFARWCGSPVTAHRLRSNM